MTDKRESLHQAISAIDHGMTVAIGGFGGAGFPTSLVSVLEKRRLHGLTIVSNNAARLEPMIESGMVARIICSFPFGGASDTLRKSIQNAAVEIKLLPQGTLSECLRAAGSGLGGVLTRVGIGTEFGEGREIVEVHGKEYLLEPALNVEVALIHASVADRWGNLVMRGTARNFNCVMAMAAAISVAEAAEVVEIGEISPERCDLPGIFVDKVVKTA